VLVGIIVINAKAELEAEKAHFIRLPFSSANRHLNVVEEFEGLSDPGSYVVRGISPMSGLPRQTGLE